MLQPYLWHPIFVHFTVALLALSAVLFATAWIAKRAGWQKQVVHAAEINLWAGTALTVFTVIAGFVAYSTVSHDEASHDIMQTHRSLALATVAWFLVLALTALWQRRRSAYPSLLFTLAMLAGAGALG